MTEDFINRLDPALKLEFGKIPAMDLTDIPRARAERMALAEMSRASAYVRADGRKRDIAVTAGHRSDVLLLRCYSPERGDEAPLPGLLWMHGGGHVLGTLDQDDPHLEFVSAELNCIVVSVDWRRAPEWPYPAAIEDCYAALAWVFGHHEALGIDATRIAIGGSSSGGGLAAGLALLARDRGEYAPCFQWLFYPMLDDRNVTPSSRAIVHPSVWNRDSNITAWTAYLGELAGSERIPIYAAPSRADDLSGLPPAFIGTAELDLFLDENIDYAQRLIASGISTELVVYPRAIHGFDLFAPNAAISRRFIRDRLDALRRAFAL